MRDEIERMVRLQAIDQELAELQRTLSAATSELEKYKTDIEKAQKELEALESEDRESMVARRELEQALAEGESQIRLKRMRLTSVRNERELQALEHEIEALKQNNQNLESELLARVEAAETRSRRISELKAEINRLQTEWREAEKSNAERLEELKVKLAKKTGEREALAAQIDPSLLQRYQLILDRRGGVALAAARGGACLGCCMQLPPQLFNEVQRALTIQFCPNCQRILYFEG